MPLRQQRTTRRRTVIRVSDPVGTLHLQRIEETKKPDNDPDGGAEEWEQNRVLWKTSISLPALWQALKALWKLIGS